MMIKIKMLLLLLALSGCHVAYAGLDNYQYQINKAKTDAISTAATDATTKANAAQAAAISTASGDATTKANAAQAAAISTASGDATTKANAIYGVIGFSTMFEGTVALLPNGVRTVAHGLGSKPRLVTVSARCVTAENGYSIGDELDAEWYAVSNHQIAFARDSTNIYIQHLGSTFVINNKTTGTAVASTVANWNWVIRAWK